MVLSWLQLYQTGYLSSFKNDKFIVKIETLHSYKPKYQTYLTLTIDLTMGNTLKYNGAKSHLSLQ